MQKDEDEAPPPTDAMLRSLRGYIKIPAILMGLNVKRYVIRSDTI